MKDFCFGLFLGMTMGALLVSNCDKVKTAIKKGQKKVQETVEKAKEKLSDQSDDESEPLVVDDYE